jgi:hypothetical protein
VVPDEYLYEMHKRSLEIGGSRRVHGVLYGIIGMSMVEGRTSKSASKGTNGIQVFRTPP